MIKRIPDFFSFLDVAGETRVAAARDAARASAKAGRMMDARDYEALAALAVHARPRRIFEIGTYLGVNSDFLLTLAPHAELVSIAYVNKRWTPFRRRYNNSELPPHRIGCEVQPERRERFTQLHGDSHRLDAGTLVRRYGRFDLVFIDGDHSRTGVAQDTALARAILAESGAIAWHDANPKPAYLDVRRFLEQDLTLAAIATQDTYVGGIAAWSVAIEAKVQHAAACSTT
jgi:predicted O-methyltransferase YrrM